MNDNTRPPIHDITAADLDTCASDKAASAIGCAAKAGELGATDEETAFSLIRAAAKYVSGARGDRARAKALRA